MEQSEENLQIRVHGSPEKPTVIYLPGVHGDWTLLSGFRECAAEQFQLVEFTYPRTLKWSLRDYAAQVHSALQTNGIHQGWLLAESFSSQVAWSFCELVDTPLERFRLDGIILAGGFVRYPGRWMVRMAEAFVRLAPPPFWRALFWFYVRYGSFRHRNALGSADCAREFVTRRTPQDLAAIAHRLRLIAENDPRENASKVRCPVYAIAGVIDPIVSAPLALRWLKAYCPKFAGYKMIWPADHNVLGTEPRKAVECIAEWLRAPKQAEHVAKLTGAVDS